MGDDDDDLRREAKQSYEELAFLKIDSRLLTGRENDQRCH